ncbi:MAG TPA: hypothetical protein PK156_36455, partial [Polyangium sp.]|nr:hypothetical protein [Polyangium sp.]
IALDAFADRPGDELLVVTDQANGKSIVSPLDTPDPTALLELPFSVADLVGDVQQGQFDEAAPCHQLLFAKRDASTIILYPPCRNDGSSGWNISAAPTTVTLPAGATIQKDILLADLDLDTHLDLLIGTNTVPYVAWGMGDGTFVSAKDGGVPNTASPYDMPSGSNDEHPLAVDEVNGDGRIDFVFPHGIFMSHGSGYEFVYQNIGAAWSSVVVEDLNTNGLKDVMLCSAESVDCTFLNNAGGGIFNPAIVPTEAPVAMLSSADFDGDLIRDVAALESHVVNGATVHNDLAVGYGRTHGPPEALALVGSLENTTQLVPAVFRDPWEKVNVLDGIADLLAVDAHEIEVNGQTKIEPHAVLFRGSASRVMFTSRPLINGTASALPLAVTIAQFADDVPEITVLGAERDSGKLRIWTIEGTAGDAAYPGPYLPTGFHSTVGTDEISFRYGALMATGDLNEDGTDEVVVVAPFGMNSDGAAVLIADYNGADDTFVPRVPDPISAAITVDDKFELQDVDHDGHLDGVFYTGTHEDPGDLIILWGDGTGKLQTNAPIHVRPEGGASGFACLSTHHGCELIVLSPNGVFSAIVSSGRNIEFTRLANLPGAASIATGDFDRDGIRDIALHTAQGLTYFRALPVNP